MEAGHQWNQDHQDEQAMNQTDTAPVEQPGMTMNLEKEYVEGAERYCGAEIQRVPDQLRAVSIRRERRTKDERDVEARPPKSLSTSEYDGHGDPAPNRPQENLVPAHVR